MEEKEFIKLYDENVAAIFRYLFLRVNSKEMAQDLSSDVFLRAWQYVKNSQEELNNPKAFFYKIAKNLLTDFYRKKSRTEISLDDITAQIPDLDQNPAEIVNINLELEPIKQVLSQIKDDYAEVVIWYYLDELTISEIAKILDKSEGATRTMLSRALEIIRKTLPAD